MLGQTIKESHKLMSLLLNNMTQPNDNSFYVTLTSQKTQEFPDNSPTQFQYRLPQSLWLPGKLKVGLASVFLPGVSNPIPHVVTTHVSSQFTHVISIPFASKLMVTRQMESGFGKCVFTWCFQSHSPCGYNPCQFLSAPTTT